MRRRRQRITPCAWCGGSVPVPRGYGPRQDEEIPFLRCHCGAVGLASLHPEEDWSRLAAEVLEVPCEEWPEPAWGLERIEQQTQRDWGRIQWGKELPPDVDVLWHPLLWGRKRRESGE